MNLGRNLRRNIKRASSRLQETFKVEYSDCSTPELFFEGMQHLFELHQKRWRSRGFSGIFANEGARAFNLDIAKLFSEKNWLGLFLMSLNGKPVTAAYGFKYQRKFYGYISGFDPTYYRYDVGNLLTAQMISQFIKEGFVEFDFMRGSEEYKYRWNTKSRWNYQAIIIRSGIRAKIENWFYKEWWRQGSRLKYFLKIR
jgi:CelD/BcsL family acetyltransferase involved in cellulose biosynthesis